MKTVIPAPPQILLPVIGETAAFPARRVYCVGRNYAAHAREMGMTTPEPPFFFAKPADALTICPARIPFPADTDNLHHEIELVAVLKSGGVNIAREGALAHVYGYAVGVDLTRRDRQAELRDGGRPWERAKSFDRSAPISAIRRTAEAPHANAARIWCAVNGQMKQDASTADMTWPLDAIIAGLSRLFELKAGDLIFTGTPEGVGRLLPGDVLTGGVDGVSDLRLELAA